MGYGGKGGMLAYSMRSRQNNKRLFYGCIPGVLASGKTIVRCWKIGEKAITLLLLSKDALLES